MDLERVLFISVISHSPSHSGCLAAWRSFKFNGHKLVTLVTQAAGWVDTANHSFQCQITKRLYSHRLASYQLYLIPLFNLPIHPTHPQDFESPRTRNRNTRRSRWQNTKTSKIQCWNFCESINLKAIGSKKNTVKTRNEVSLGSNSL